MPQGAIDKAQKFSVSVGDENFELKGIFEAGKPVGEVTVTLNGTETAVTFAEGDFSLQAKNGNEEAAVQAEEEKKAEPEPAASPEAAQEEVKGPA